MNALRNLVDKVKPNFEKKAANLKSSIRFSMVLKRFYSFRIPPLNVERIYMIFVDSKRTMIIVVLALVPALLFGMYNVGYQHYLAIGETVTFWPFSCLAFWQYFRLF